MQLNLDETTFIESLNKLGEISVRKKISAQMAKNIDEIKQAVGPITQ